MSDYTQVSVTSLNSVINQVNHISSQVEAVGQCVLAVNERVNYVDGKLQQLQQQFLRMMMEQRNAAALQRAISRLTNVRQELESRFGTHKEVREHLLGILQATDLALVKQNTVSRVSEELMLKAPQYWLAPCLVALSGWICNDEALAKRAIKEAVRRDKEKTCMLFALICQRAGRTATSFEWLREYFGMQNPERMRSSVVAFIDCYENGIFGEDKDNVCADNINYWIKTLKDKHPDFDNEQKEYWKNVYEQFGSVVKERSDYVNKYSDLKEFCPEYNLIDGFVSRIEGTGYANEWVSDMNNAEIDVNAEKKRIDAELRKLITNYEDVRTEQGKETEEELRYDEMEYEFTQELQATAKRELDNGKNFDLEEEAKKRIAIIKNQRFDAPVDFVARLRTSVFDKGALPSAKKTAVRLLKSYIVDAYKEYITENKDSYPDKINLKVEATISGNDVGGVSKANYSERISWAGVTEEGENREQLKKALAAKYDAAKEDATSKIKTPGYYWILVVPALVANSRNKKRRAAIEAKIDAEKNAKLKSLDNALNGRIEANKVVNDFIGKSGWDTVNFDEVASTEINTEENA